MNKEIIATFFSLPTAIFESNEKKDEIHFIH
jgi:hypothetical protein